MVKIFTDQNIATVGAMRSYLLENDISSQLRNEFSSSVMGEIAFFDVWPELWVHDDDASRARELVADIRQPTVSGPDWVCRNCTEHNPGTFEVCWSCSATKA